MHTDIEPFAQFAYKNSLVDQMSINRSDKIFTSSFDILR